MSRTIELKDVEAVLLAIFGAGAAYAVNPDWRVAVVAALGVLVVRIGAGALLHGTRKIPLGFLPDLTDRESSVASLIHAGYGDPAIAARLGISLKRIEGRVQRIQTKWRVSTRKEIAQHVAQIRGEPPEHPTTRFKQRWEMIAEIGTGIAVMALGVGMLTLPPETALIGGWREWLGLSLVIGGFLYGAVSIAMYAWERAHSKREG